MGTMTVRMRTDVFVVGGGPAGLAAAIAARQQGLSAMVADGGEPPIEKPCGEGLLPETQVALAELGVSVPRKEGYRFGGIRFLDGDVSVRAEFSHGDAIGLRRTLLHSLLIARAEQCGVELFWKTPVTGISPEEVQLPKHGVSSRWIVGADGSASRVRQWAGLATTKQSEVNEKDRASLFENHTRFASRRHYRIKPWTKYLEIYWGAQAQAYVTPVSEEEVCVVVLADTPERAKFAETWANWPSLERRLANAGLAGKERGAITSMHSSPNVRRGNVALVGDASGSVDAITGDGLRLAFRQGVALAEAMKWGDLARYENTHRRLMRRPTWMGRIMLMLGRHSAMRQRAIRSLTARPEIFAEFVAFHVGENNAVKLLGTGARLGWEFLTG